MKVACEYLIAVSQLGKASGLLAQTYQTPSECFTWHAMGLASESLSTEAFRMGE